MRHSVHWLIESVVGSTSHCTPWTDIAETFAGQLADDALNEVEQARVAEDCVISNGDTINSGQVVIYSLSAEAPPRLGCVRELLVTEPYILSPTVNFAIIEKMAVGPQVLPYGMPGLQFLRSFETVPVNTLHCAVNVQHNCARNECDLSRRVTVQQERQDTANTRAAIRHKNNLEDMVLNTAKMRDARWVQKFAPEAPTTDFEAIVNASVEREFQ